MKKLIVLFAIVFGYVGVLQSQHRSNNWVMGISIKNADTSLLSIFKMDFGEVPFKISKFNSSNNYDPAYTNASISSESGDLLLFSDGVSIFNDKFQIVENGALLPSDPTWHSYVPNFQAGLFLPFPDTKDSIIFLTGDIFNFYWEPLNANVGGQKNFTYSVIDMSANNGKGKMVERKTMLLQDTMPGGMISAVKHANGRDWWTVVFRYHRNEYYPILFTPDGPIVYPYETMAGAAKNSAGQSAFSPDGTWYARYNAASPPAGGYLDLYHFDRCTGRLSDPQHKMIATGGFEWGGIAFSPNSRFVYAAAFDSIFQFDLQDADILGSQTLVAVYDGFTHDLIPNDSTHTFMVPTRFFQMALAPDGKIYITVPGTNTYYIHTIEQPNLKGLACDVRQHSIHFPVSVEYAIPNLPNYNLGRLIGSPCDTLPLVSTKAAPHKGQTISVYPNPATDWLWVEMEKGQGYTFTLYDILGRKWLELQLNGEKTDVFVGDLAAGLYLYSVRDAQSKGIWKGKIVKE